MRFHDARTIFVIPNSIIRRHVKEVTNRGRKTVIAEHNKENFVNHFLHYAARDIPLILNHLRDAFIMVATRLEPARRLTLHLRGFFASARYLESFRRRRYHRLKLGRPFSQESKRFRVINEEAMTQHFCLLESPILKNCINADR